MKILSKYGKIIAMSAAALGMTAALTVESSLAYFTTYVSSGGGGTVSLGVSAEIRENVSDMTKHVTIVNTSENECYVRVKVFAGSVISYDPAGTNWSEEADADGYWYYGEILPGGGETSVLDVVIKVPEGFNEDDFNVVVVQECVPVFYDDNGNPYADWNVGKGGADE